MTEHRQKLLIVEEDLGLQKQIKCSYEGFDVFCASSREETLALLSEVDPDTKIIVLSGHGAHESALCAIFALQQPDNDGALLLGTIRTGSPEMVKVARTIERIAPADISVLLLGASGTGKELLARGLHNASGRRDKPFVAINCGAIPENLLESELFGHEKGAFTGAVKTTEGKIELAHGGTLFLDEVGDIPLALQVKLLRFLQERNFERIGGRKAIHVDVRLVCATHRNLSKMISEHAFRDDLFYRLAEVTVNIPPFLRARGTQFCWPSIS